MHHMGKTLDAHIFFYFYSTDLTDLSDIVSSKIHKHVVLGTFFFIGEKSSFQLQIFFFCLASRSGSCQREGA